ncbi:5277_t:CDS:1, partial [Ambispora leptoticha]
MGNITPAPSIEEVSSMLNRSRRESLTGQRDRSASPIRRTPSRRDETTNRDNAGRNLNNATYSSSSELANMISKLNTSTSRSDSDLSMPDVGDSQPPQVEPINEEG